jgi:hypothetical protein
MADKQNIGIKQARQWKTMALSASIIGGCLLIAVPAFAKVIDAPAQPVNTPVQPANVGTNNSEQVKVMQQKLEDIQNQLNQMTSGLVSQSVSAAGLPIHGFMDVGFRDNSQGRAVVNPNVPNPTGFYQGNLSFYLAPHFSDRVLALAEPNFEIDKADGTVSTDIERLQIGYAFSDAATLWLGRFHTPYGYWNTAFHHGAQLQTSIERPRFLDFEDLGGILPAHTVGVWGTGKVRTGSGRFTYDWYVGNGPKIAGVNTGVATVPVNDTDYQTGGLDPNIAGDDNHNALVGFNLGYDFSGVLDGLRLAVHWLQGDINSYGDGSSTMPYYLKPDIQSTTTLNVGGGSLVYLTNEWEIMGEYYGFVDKDKYVASSFTPPGGANEGNKYKSRAGYLQVGFNIGEWTPYVRFERTILDQNDNYFNTQANGQSYARQALGIRYNIDPKACLKLALMNSHFMTEPGRTSLSYRSVNLQYAIGF